MVQHTVESVVETRTCRTCHQSFILNKIGRKSRRCRLCRNAAWRASYAKHGHKWKDKEKTKIYQRERNKDPVVREKNRQSKLRYREKNRLKSLVRAARCRSRTSGVECDEDYLNELADEKPSHCQCCHGELGYKLGTRSRNRPKNMSPSFDRIHVSRGYVRGNVAIICWRCNALKRDGVLHEFENIVEYIKRRST